MEPDILQELLAQFEIFFRVWPMPPSPRKKAECERC